MAMAVGEIPALPIMLIFSILKAIFHCLYTTGADDEANSISI